MEITPHRAGAAGETGLLAGPYLDPRELGPTSPVRDLARAFLQELRDKGRSETTLPRYERFLVEFLDFIGRDGATPRVRDIDIRILKAYASHLTRRRLLAGPDVGTRATDCASPTRSPSSARVAATARSSSAAARASGSSGTCARARTPIRRSSSRAARRRVARTG